MTQTLTLEHFRTLTPQQQQEVITFIEFLQSKNQPDEITEEPAISVLESAGELVGCLDSGQGDLSLKKKELKPSKL